MAKLKQSLIKLSELINLFYPRSFAQEGEDVILQDLLFKKKSGLYIDIGAHHPKRFSNTYFFYRRGWRGINIDAQPGSMHLFNIYRKRDINIECGVGSKSGELDYYIFDETAVNTFNPINAKLAEKNNKLIEIRKIPIEPLSKILDQHLKNGQTIDIMSIDVEGLDYDVLISNDWSKYIPKIILVEVPEFDNLNSGNKIYEFLKDKGYTFFAKTPRTLIMKHEDFHK